jgi:hypothetical protein
MKQCHLAAALGLSPAAVSRLAARGMPTSSAEAAHAWRREHVRVRVPAQLDRRQGSGDAARLLHRVTALAATAAEALAGHAGDFSVIEPELRSAIAALPAELRERMLIECPTPDAVTIGGSPATTMAAPHARVPLAVMDALTADVRAALMEDLILGKSDDEPPGAAGLAVMGRFWVRVAAGEVRAAAGQTR